jgi:putative transposase
MKGKRYTTEDKIRILREADGGKAILEVCREHNISEVSFHRWKRQLGQLDVSEARRLKELERENSELKKMLAESLLKNRVLEAVCEKNSKPGTTAADGKGSGRGRVVLWSGGVPHSAIIPFDLLVSRTATDAGRGAVKKTAARTVGATSTVWVSADRGVIERGRLGGGQTADPATASGRGFASATDETEANKAGYFDRLAHPSDASGSCLDVGLHGGCDRAWGSLADADDPG